MWRGEGCWAGLAETGDKARVWMLGFAQEKRKTRGGRTWWVIAADEGHEDGGFGTWRKAAAAQSSAPETANRAHARANKAGPDRRRRLRFRPTLFSYYY